GEQEGVQAAVVVEDQRLVEAADPRDRARGGSREADGFQRLERRLDEPIPCLSSRFYHMIKSFAQGGLPPAEAHMDAILFLLFGAILLATVAGAVVSVPAGILYIVAVGIRRLWR